MRENRLKAIWGSGQSAIGGWLTVPSSLSAETMAHAGFDWLCIDMQHGTIDYQVGVTMMQAISTTETVPIVRVPWNEPGIIMKSLDAGAYGVIIPMVNSRAEAEAAVGACRYAPWGYRSYGPGRAVLYAGRDYAAHANETVLCICMIETGEAVANLEEILSVPGIDAVYVGPSDLSVSLGLPPQYDNPAPRVHRGDRRDPRRLRPPRNHRRRPLRDARGSAQADRAGLPLCADGGRRRVAGAQRGGGVGRDAGGESRAGDGGVVISG